MEAIKTWNNDKRRSEIDDRQSKTSQPNQGKEKAAKTESLGPPFANAAPTPVPTANRVKTPERILRRAEPAPENSNNSPEQTPQFLHEAPSDDCDLESERPERGRAIGESPELGLQR